MQTKNQQAALLALGACGWGKSSRLLVEEKARKWNSHQEATLAHTAIVCIVLHGQEGCLHATGGQRA